MTKTTDTTLEKRQENLAQMITTCGNMQGNIYWEAKNILPLIRAKDRVVFLSKHTVEYKERLQALLQRIFWALPAERELPLADKFIDDLQALIEAIANDLSKQKL